MKHERKFDIFSAGPSITELEKEYVGHAIDEMWLYGGHAYITEFEKKMAQYIGRKYTLALPSGTSAIHLSLLACGIGPGDEVIVPDFTWVATVTPVLQVGATPVFVDVDRNNWCITETEIKKHITRKTKAVYTVDMYGNMPDYDEIIDLLDENGIILLEDSAEAVGSEYKGRKAGSIGKASVFSFQASKLISTEEGGMLLTDDEELYIRANKLANVGKSLDKKTLWVDEVGYKYKYSGLQAAMGLAQLERIDKILEKRKTIFDWYKNDLKDINGIWMNDPGENVKSNYWLSTVVFDDKIYDFVKEELVAYLKEKGIETRPVMYQLTGMPVFEDLKPDWKNKNAEYISRMGINLPTPADLSKEQEERVVSELCGYLDSHRR